MEMIAYLIHDQIILTAQFRFHSCEVRKCYKKGQEIDYEKASAIVVDDFRSGRIGRITLNTRRIQKFQLLIQPDPLFPLRNARLISGLRAGFTGKRIK